MDQTWINSLDKHTVVVVPTRSLASTLNETIADFHIAQHRSVWEAANILTWQDLCQQLWQANRQQISVRTGAYTVISAQQGLLLWNKVIEQSRHAESDLTLLNVQQTVRAVQRSWRNMHDWQLSAEAIQQQAIADSDQFLTWAKSYQQLLEKQHLLDDQQLLTALIAEPLTLPFKRIIWYAFDLTTTAQQRLLDHCQMRGCELEVIPPAPQPQQTRNYHCYSQSDEELLAVLQQARARLEAEPNTRINLVIPDLQLRLSEVAEVAREVFYPGVSPLQLQQSELAYRFSLGQPLHQWPAIETALLLINNLKGRLTVSDLEFLLRSEFLRQAQTLRSATRPFLGHLQRQRIHAVQIDALSDEYQNYLQDQRQRGNEPANSPQLEHFLQQLNAFLVKLHDQQQTQKDKTGYAALSFSDWLDLISEWLAMWGWSTSTTEADTSNNLNSVQYQLLDRWQDLLRDFATLETVQFGAGLRRVCEILFQMTRDTVFLPKASASPILISGIYEAVGRPAQLCLLTGMDDRYPALPASDPFIGNVLRQHDDFPGANATTHFDQTRKVVESLLASAKEVRISYAQHDASEEDIRRGASSIFRLQAFTQQPSPDPAIPATDCELDEFSNPQGPTWTDTREIRGGSSIFEHQSNCAFRAFATFQLGFTEEPETEFGLDHLDRGTIVHRLLEQVWGQLHTQAELLLHIQQQTLQPLIDKVVDKVLHDVDLKLLSEKQQLLKLEAPRLSRLLRQWLEVDAKRPADFQVTECERQWDTEIANIPVRLKIDRLDEMDDGRSVIIDYKTGNVAKSDWTGERLRKPQLPLYAVALSTIKPSPPSGIAYAKVKQHECAYQELAEVDIFKTSNGNSQKTEQQWQESRAQWPAIFEQLGQDFLNGRAAVNPIDESTCNYCELQPMCRISQLRGLAQTADSEPAGGSDD